MSVLTHEFNTKQKILYLWFSLSIILFLAVQQYQIIFNGKVEIILLLPYLTCKVTDWCLTSELKTEKLLRYTSL